MVLLSIIRKNKLKERELRILFLGLDNSGKSTILKRVQGKDIDSVSPTLGFDIFTIMHNGLVNHPFPISTGHSSHIHLDILSMSVSDLMHSATGCKILNLLVDLTGDVGGQKTLRPYWRNYFERTDCIVWVVDSGDRERIQDCRDELWSLLGEERLAGATILIFANKQDIHGAMTGEEIQRSLQLDRIRLHSWRIQPCSAVTGEHLLKGLDWAVKDVGNRIHYYGASHLS